MPNIRVFKTLANKYMLTVTCNDCKKNKTVTVEPQDYFNWTQKGQLIQYAFPYLTKDEREILVSGFCGPCFDKIFAGDEDK